MKPQRIPVTLRLPVALKRRLERLARAEGRSINNYITNALQTAVDCMDVAEAFNAARIDVGVVAKQLQRKAMIERGFISEHEDVDRNAQLRQDLRLVTGHEEPDF